MTTGEEISSSSEDGVAAPLGPADERAQDVEDVEAAIRRRVEEQADAWFPGSAGLPVQLHRMVERPRAVLYGVHIGDRSRQPQILAKVRRGWPGRELPGGRPRLMSGALSSSELTALEYDGLTRIRAMVPRGDPDFGAVRPLDHLVAADTILMEFVGSRTLRQLMMSESRLFRWRAPSRRPTARAWGLAGAWLRAFQAQMPPGTRPARQTSRSDVVDRFLAYDDFLRARLGDRALGGVAFEGAELAAEVLPERLSMAVGHGDYAPRNVFVDADGRVSVFDPLPRWVVPRLEDLARFLVAIRMQGIQLHTRGAAYPEQALERWERDVINGFRGATELRLPEVRCHQLLITLDKWSALVDTPSAGIRNRVRTASLELGSGYLRGEARRLIRLAESGSGSDGG